MIESSSDEESDVESPPNGRRVEPEVDTLSVNSAQGFYQSKTSLSSSFNLGGSRSESPSFHSRLSPAPSISSLNLETGEEDNGSADRKEKLLLYVFTARCIAYPFNAKQPTDMARRQSKVTKQNMIAIKERFSAFLNGKINIPADDALRNAVQSYYDTFLCSDRVLKMVNSGGYSSNDFREIFKASIEKRVRNLPEIEGLSKETVLSSWMVKFDAIYRGDEDQKKTPARLAATAASEIMLSKEQLYDMFQQVLQVKKHEHQIIFNNCQLDNADEQTGAIRRQLQTRESGIELLTRENMPRFIHKNMEDIYKDEQRAMISQLKANLENVPVGKAASDQKSSLYKMKKTQNTPAMMEVPEDSLQIDLVFNLQVVVMEAEGLNSLPGQKIVFVVMELEGDEKLQTDQAEASKPVWETSGEWTIKQPLPVVKLRLMAENHSLLSLDHKELAKLQLEPNCGMSEGYEWLQMQVNKGWSGDEVKLKVSVKMEKPPNVKKSGFLFIKSKNVWKKWKKRYLMLIQVSQYNFMLCSFRPKKSQPSETVKMQGYTVDFIEALRGEEYAGGRFFFQAVKEGDTIEFASDSDGDRQMWVNKLYIATGQSHKPELPQTPVNTLQDKSGSLTRYSRADTDRAIKYGLDDVIQADPEQYDQAKLFQTLQRLTLSHRLNDSYTCLGWFSPGQVYILDEYCTRYGVRGCHRHLCYLSDLLERAEAGIMIDPTLLHYSYAFCASHVLGNRPDGVNTVTLDEKQKFEEIKERLREFLANQITHFRYCFPFGRPEGALKSTLTLYERVLTKDTMTPVEPEEVRNAVRKCLQKAALVNYTRLSAYAKIEEISGTNSSPTEKLEKVMQLAELCIELIQQNEEHHSEALAWYADLMVEHTEIFWCLYAVDMDEALSSQFPDTWDSFALFQMLNNYLRMEPSLNKGKFHAHLKEKFAPLVIRYIDLMESSIARSVHHNFGKESWVTVGNSCAAAEDMFWKLQSIQAFIRDLHWPDDDFSEHLSQRLKLMASDMIDACINRCMEALTLFMSRARVDFEYILDRHSCVVLNTICESSDQASTLSAVGESVGDEHNYHSNIDDVLESAKDTGIDLIVEKLCVNLVTILRRLSRYDHGTLKSHVFSMLSQQEDLAEHFAELVVANLHQFRNHINDEKFIIRLVQGWWNKIFSLLWPWINDRKDIPLAHYQLKVLSDIMEAVRKVFELEGLPEKVLETSEYKAVYSKLQLEDAILNLNQPTLPREIEYDYHQMDRQVSDEGD